MKTIVPDDNCLTQEQLSRYLQDDCSAEESRRIDRHLAHCPMCSDAFEGAMLMPVAKQERVLGRLENKINTQFANKTQPQQVEQPTLTVVKKRSFRGFWWAVAAFAATVTAAGVIFLRETPTVQEMPTSVAQTSPDTLQNTVTAIIPQTDSIRQYPNTSPSVQSEKSDVVQAVPAQQSKKIESPASSNTTSHSMVDPYTNSKIDQPSNVSSSVGSVTTSVTKDIPIILESPTPSNAKVMESAEKDMAVTKQKQVYPTPASVTMQNAEKQKQVSPTPASANMQNTESSSNDIKTNIITQNTAPSMASEKKAAKIQTANSNDASILYQAGMKYFQKGDYNKAIGSLNHVLAQHPTGEIYENASWYLANCYMRLDKKKESKPIFQKIATENGTYGQQAELILKNWKD